MLPRWFGTGTAYAAAFFAAFSAFCLAFFFAAVSTEDPSRWLTRWWVSFISFVTGCATWGRAIAVGEGKGRERKGRVSRSGHLLPCARRCWAVRSCT